MFVKFSNCSIIGTSFGTTGRVAARKALGSFEYDDRGDGFLYVSVRACTADVPNLNFDMLPHEELKTAYRTFVGKPVYVNHSNTNLDRARGYIIDAVYHDEDPEDRWIEILMEMDEVTFPRLCALIRSGDIDTVSMGLNCFVPGTHITMSNGTVKNIEDVAVGDEVITHLGNVRRVADTMASLHSGIVYEVRSYGSKRPMVLTDEHPVWVRRMKNDAMRTIRESRIAHDGDNAEHSCICGRSFKSHRSLAAHVREAAKNGVDGHGYQPDFEGWVIASDLEVGDYVLDPKPVRTSRGGNRVFARLLGYYLAEGNFGYDKKLNIGVGAPAFVEWTFCDSETDYHDEVMALCSELGYKAVGPYIKRGAATIRCNSPELANMMLEHGGKYSHGKRISDEAMRWDDECLGDLVEAYLNGDGHYIDDHRVAYSTVSKDLAYQIFSICTQLGIKMSKPIARPSERISDIAKHTRYVSYGDRSEEQKKMAMCYVDEQGTWRRIDRIRVLPYTGMVYNFEVEEDHSYIAEGYAVHNCETTTCSVCGNVAEQPAQFCNHIKQKGREFDGVLAFEICNGIAFFEESWVYDPADPTATVQALEAEAKTAKVAAKEREFGPDNFYIETEANFAEVEDRPQGAPDYTSESGSEYWYFPDGVIRGSDHWGYGVGGCNWYLDGINRQMYGGELYGYARWSDFENTENYDYIFDKKLNDVVESYVGSGADGTLADHMFGTMQWRHTDMNDEVYDEARTLLRVTAAEKSKSDYAYTPTDNPSDWKLDISDKDHAAAAKAALGKGYRGNKVEIPSDDRQAVIDKVNAACRRFGIEPFGEGKEGSADDASGFASDFIEEYDSLGLSFDSYDELAAEVWSAVEEAADADEEFYADALQEIAGHYKLADNMVNKLRIPEEADMQNSDRVCPICGSPDFDGIYCDVCEYVEYAEGFGDIDTEEAQENKELRKDLDDAEEPDAEVTEDAEEEYAEDTDDARVAGRLFDVPDDQGTVLAALADAGYAEGIDYDLASGGKIASYSASLDELMRGGVIGKESRWL